MCFLCTPLHAEATTCARTDSGLQEALWFAGGQAQGETRVPWSRVFLEVCDGRGVLTILVRYELHVGELRAADHS